MLRRGTTQKLRKLSCVHRTNVAGVSYCASLKAPLQGEGKSVRRDPGAGPLPNHRAADCHEF